ncbi:MAG: hypothetical protein HYS63_02055 [Methylocystis sp.]|nr:hypothetical protein [Methylocystis sp.]
MAAAFLSRFFMKLFSAAPKRLKEPKKRDQRRHADGVKHNSFPRRSNPRSEREKANAGDESNKRSLLGWTAPDGIVCARMRLSNLKRGSRP